MNHLTEDNRSIDQLLSELAFLQRKFNIIVNHTESVETWILPDMSVAFVSRGIEKITGYPAEDFVKDPDLFRKMIHPDDLQKYSKLYAKISETELPAEIDRRIICKSGEIRWVHTRITKIYDDQGNYDGFRSSTTDVTDLKMAEKRLVDTLLEVQDLKAKLEQENKYLRETYLPAKTPDGIVTDSPLMHDVLDKVKQVALTDSPVLIFGETGTGKELIAQAIHNASKRRKRMMVTVSCAALPPSLIESELFGRERGAYTGALSSQIGRFELAENSTIFLDEIGDLPLDLQVKLLRVIQFGEFQMLGSSVTKKVDIRIIAATNKDLTKAMADGTFRSDLFYRLNVFPINLPPLRERKEDIPLLAWSFVDEIAGRSGKRIDKISTRSMNKLLKHSWPGNIRELRNLIEYSIILAQSPVLEVFMPETEPEQHKGDNLESEQRRHIEKVLNQTGWRIRGEGGAAEKLGIKESTLRFRMKKLGIERKK